MCRNFTYAKVMKRQSTETAKNLILDEVTPQLVPGRRTGPPPIEASELGVSVFETAIPMARMSAGIETKLLSEINEHMKILIDTYGRTTGMRAPPIEALALRMMTIMNEIDVQTDGIIKGDESANMTTDGILMDLEQVHPCTTSTTSAASTVQASSVMANVFEPDVEPDVPMASDFPTTEVDADAISLPTTPESGRTTTRIAGLKGHRVHLPKSET